MFDSGLREIQHHLKMLYLMASEQQHGGCWEFSGLNNAIMRIFLVFKLIDLNE